MQGRSQLLCACVVLLALAGVLAVSAQQATATDPGCDVFAAPPSLGGDNSNSGKSLQTPVATIRKLLAIVPRGRGEEARGVACVRRGTYDFSRSLEATLAKPWTTLRPYDGEAATLVGRLVIGVKARHAVVAGLTLNGYRPGKPQNPSLLVYGDRSIVRDNVITNDHTEICVHVTDYFGDRAKQVTIAGNEIYGCGAIEHLNHDHGIYVANANRTRILGNHIHDNQDRGIQLWPNADRSLVEGNVVDQNGQGILVGGERRRGPDLSSDHNVIRGNLITHSQANYEDPDGAGPIQENKHGWNLEFISNPGGDGNLVEGNCLFADHPDPQYTTNAGINLSDSDGVPVTFRLGPNAVLRSDQVGGALGRSGCEEGSLVSAALPRDCAPAAMLQRTGTPGPDDFDGTELRDYVVAGDGDDSLSGAGAGDCLFGGTGNDLLAGDGDADHLFGDDGDDTTVSREAADPDWRSDQVSCGAGVDVVFADITDAVNPDCETAIYRAP